MSFIMLFPNLEHHWRPKTGKTALALPAVLLKPSQAQKPLSLDQF
ncbi:MAG: hypothetical protein ACR2PX_18270 [Endozoicomonas sp.]